VDSRKSIQKSYKNENMEIFTKKVTRNGIRLLRCFENLTNQQSF